MRPLIRSALAPSLAGLMLALPWPVAVAPAAGEDGAGTAAEAFVLPGDLAADGAAPAALRHLEERHTDDLDALIARGAIRVLVSYDRTNFFVVDGEARGFEYDLIQQYRDHLKTRVRARSWPVQFVFLPVPFDRLIPALVEGRGDIAAAGLTVTPEREALVAFTDPYLSDVREVVVTSGAAEGLETLDDLAGRRIYVDARTSFAEHLRALGAGLEARGLAPIEVVPADPKLVTEDILRPTRSWSRRTYWSWSTPGWSTSPSPTGTWRGCGARRCPASSCATTSRSTRAAGSPGRCARTTPSCCGA